MFKEVLEYRGCICERKSYLDKETNQKKEYVTLTHNFEATDGRVVFVKELNMQGVNPDTYKSPYARGKKYMVDLAMRLAEPVYAQSIQAA
jgi:hypothetical protein